MRKIKFEKDKYYHAYNRGVDKRNIFDNEKDYIRFLTSMREFNRPDSIDSLYRLNQIARKDTECLRFEKNRRHSVSTNKAKSWKIEKKIQ